MKAVIRTTTFALLFIAIFLAEESHAQANKLRWVQESAKAAWQPRDSQGEVVFRNKLWVLGGWFNSYEAPPRDVWSSEDGKDWKLVTKEAPWIHSDLPMSIAFKNRMWMMGGWYNGRLAGHSASNEVWSSKDGKTWTQAGKAQWSARTAAALVEFKGKMWILGGIENYYFGTKESLKNDVWCSSDGKNWTQATASAPWPPRSYHQAAVLNGRMYVMGGGNYTPEYFALNDVWSTDDGVNWVKETDAAPWHQRIWFSSVVYRDHIWIIGGWSGNPYKNWPDAWYSKDGKNWKQLVTEGDTWRERHELSAYVFKDRLWVAGGMVPPLVNDVWSIQIPKSYFKEK